LRGATLAGMGGDLAAGLTLAAIAIPEQMATARLGGFPAQAGFFVFVVAALAFAVFGANRQLSVGADSTITPIFAGSLALIAATGSPQYAALAAVLAVMVGVAVTAAGLFRLGWVADLLSRPVITGFLAGIALHIVLSQAPGVLGLPQSAGDTYARLASLWRESGAINPFSLAIGLGVFAVALTADRLSARIPGALIALAGASLATSALGLERRGVAVLGEAAGGQLRPQWPRLPLEDAPSLVGLALVIALVVMVQTAATTRAFSGEGEDPDVDRDYIGVGIGSLIAGFFGGFPVNASPPRTAIVAETGGRSQYAGLVAALVVAPLALFGTRLLAQVPIAALGGVLLYVAARILHWRAFIELWRKARGEFALAALTTSLIIALPIQTGVAIGMFLSVVHGVYTITRVRLIGFERAPGTTVWWPVSTHHHGETEPGVLVMGFQAPLSFLNAYEFRRDVREAVAAGAGRTRLFVLEASSIVTIDFTAATLLGEVIDEVKAAGLGFAVARLESVRAQEAFERFGLGERLGEAGMFLSVEAAIHALARGPA